MPDQHPSHSRQPQVAAAYVQPLLDLVEDFRLSRTELASLAGLHAQALNQLDESLPALNYVRLLDAGAQLANDENFGLHVGERVKLGTYHVYGMVLMSCKNLAQALEQTQRYEGLAHELGRSELSISNGFAHYHWHNYFPTASRHLVESVFAGIRVFADWFLGQPLPSMPLYFAHAQPANISEHQRIFGEQIVFAQSANYARFPSSLLDYPVPNSDTGLYDFLCTYADRMLHNKHRQDIVAQVQTALVKQLTQEQVRLGDIANALKLSQRSLQRKLADAGFSFQQVLDLTRQDLSKKYLQESELSLADIAFLLGYREQSAFQHAFKLWTGITPMVYRKQKKSSIPTKNLQN